MKLWTLWTSTLLFATAAAAAVVDPRQRQPAPGHPMNRNRQLQDAETPDNTFPRQRLKQKLLENYDRTTFPFEQIWESQNTTLRKGVDVKMGINFHRVFDVDVTTSVADLIVWVRQTWTDPRLAWNESEHNNISSVRMWIGDGSGAAGEMSQIWTPDLQLWNLDSPISTTLTDSYAMVFSDGSVNWSRPGHIKPVCKFRGLDDFPFDTLDCTMEIGSWTYSGLFLRLTKLRDGYSIGGSETAGESYAEYHLSDVSCEEHVYPPYPAAPEEDWPVLFYHITFQRAWQPYARGFLTLQVILNCAAFCCLWLPPHIGERMSLAITSVVAAVASELVVAAQLPPASDQTWFSKFSIVSLLFTALVMFESATVIYFHYHTGRDLKPRWYKWIENKLSKSSTSSKHDNVQPEDHEKSVKFSADQDETAPESNDETKRSTESSGEHENIKEVSPDANAKEKPTDAAKSYKSSDYYSAHENSESAGIFDYMQRSSAEGFEDVPRRSSMSRSSFRTRERIKTILGRDADDFKNFTEMENNIRWQHVASNIDDWARVLFPAAFCVFLASTFTNISV